MVMTIVFLLLYEKQPQMKKSAQRDVNTARWL